MLIFKLTLEYLLHSAAFAAIVVLCHCVFPWGGLGFLWSLLHYRLIFGPSISFVFFSLIIAAIIAIFDNQLISFYCLQTIILGILTITQRDRLLDKPFSLLFVTYAFNQLLLHGIWFFYQSQTSFLESSHRFIVYILYYPFAAALCLQSQKRLDKISIKVRACHQLNGF